MSYLPVELHCHTLHSDGKYTVSQLQNKALDDHLAVIALTDHNTNSGCREIDDNILPVIKGTEWTTYFGHILVLDSKSFVDWREATIDNIDEKIIAIKESGGTVGIAHPFQVGSPICTGGRFEFNIKKWQNVDYMEIWHRELYPNKSENVKAVALWTSLLDQGYRIACTYGKDWHSDDSLNQHYGCTYLDIQDETSAKSALKSLKIGRSVVSYGAKFFFRVHQKMNTYNIGETIRKGKTIFSFFTDYHTREKNFTNGEIVEYKSIKIITNGGECVLETRFDQRHERINVKPNHWYRAELWGTVNSVKCPLAITSPIYCE